MTLLKLCFYLPFYVFLLSLFTRIPSALFIGHRYTNLLQDTLSTDPAWPLEILRSTEVNKDFLTGRPQVVKVGQFTSNSITLNVGAPQGCVLSPLLYSLYTHDCVSSHSSTSIVKFSDDTVVLDLISNNDETAYLDEVERLTSWCQDNCLSLNVSKTKELMVDFRKRQQRPYTPLMISGTPVERVSSFKYLGVNISEDLTWTAHIQTRVKKARQRLYHL